MKEVYMTQRSNDGNFVEAQHDARMNEAIRLAKETVMMPFELLERGRTQAVSLKTAFVAGDKIENAWVMVKRTTENGFMCVLQNDLKYSQSPKLGDEVLVTPDKIVDWTCKVDALEGKMAGNYTLRVIWATLPDGEKVEVGSKLAPSAHDDALGFTFYRTNKKASLPYGPLILAVIGGLFILGYWFLREHFK